MCDKLVFDLSQEVEGSPNVFIRKDWINILDNMNQNYQNNQCIIDTSQLANSNKYMSYREAYLSMPLLLTAQFTPSVDIGAGAEITYPDAYSFGLKNWFGSMIHSFTLDYNGTTIIQQTPFINMWNIFKLLTSLSYQDVMTMGPTIGFYPDTSDSFTYSTTTSASGPGCANNDMQTYMTTGDVNAVAAQLGNDYSQYSLNVGGNTGATYRTKWIAYEQDTTTGSTVGVGVAPGTYGNLLTQDTCRQMWKSNINTLAGSRVPFVAEQATLSLIHI